MATSLAVSALSLRWPDGTVVFDDLSFTIPAGRAALVGANGLTNNGGAFVVFSGTLHDNMQVLALEGSYASVIGGAPAAAVVFAHQHPSGVSEPSSADRMLTQQLQAALALIDVRVLDHIIVGQGAPFSFAESGLL